MTLVVYIFSLLNIIFKFILFSSSCLADFNDILISKTNNYFISFFFTIHFNGWFYGLNTSYSLNELGNILTSIANN